MAHFDLNKGIVLTEDDKAVFGECRDNKPITKIMGNKSGFWDWILGAPRIQKPNAKKVNLLS